jgi:hypothetical protein
VDGVERIGVAGPQARHEGQFERSVHEDRNARTCGA